jgi:putative methyltransferase (TIGR04325 family)
VTLRQFAHRILPPIVTDALRAVIGRRAPQPGRFEIVGKEWPHQADANPGWEDAGIAESQAERWQAFCAACEGPVPLDVAHEATEPLPRNMAFHNTYMTFGYVLALAAAGRDEVSMLDWGGGLGHYAVLAKALLPDSRTDYHCKDLPAFCEQGSALMPEATFYSDDACLGRRYDLVVASGSLQCSREWRDVVAGLAAATGRYLYITRLPVLLSAPTVVVRQQARIQGFNDDLLGWFLNRDEFLAHLEWLGMELVREFYVDEHPHVEGASEQADVRGFLFRPQAS